MDFFGHQEQAQRRTRLLYLWFTCAVVLIVFAVYIAVTASLFAGQFFQRDTIDLLAISDWFYIDAFWHVKRFAWVAFITMTVIVTGSAYKIHQLRKGGGAAVAEMLGGKRLASNADDPLYRQLLNIVEEMAIASGLPVPPVYVLGQSGINAFAAGFSPSDTVIGVTRGAIAMLNRDELQGVIAHEFSHILHGDTRINMRMMGLLHGMTVISNTGMVLLTGHTTFRSLRRSTRKQGALPALLVLGFLLFMVGLVGMVVADLIKRAVSRQREFLADASAVQFTRNPAGIAGALKVIGGYKAGSRVNHGEATPVGHFFFGNALKREANGSSTDWWASHPPLLDRIRRIEPSFRGQLKAVSASSKQQRVLAEASLSFAQGIPENAQVLHEGLHDYHAWLTSVGQPQKVQLSHVAEQIQRIPTRLRDFAHDSYTARAVCYALLLDLDHEQRRVQLELLETSADKNVFREMLDVQIDVKKLPIELRLPLIDMMIPALKSLSLAQYRLFVKNIQRLIKANQKVSLFEFVLQRVLLRHLKPAFSDIIMTGIKYKKTQQVAAECGCVLAILIGYGSHQQPKALFEKMTAELLGEALPWPPEKALQLNYLDQALFKLELAAPSVKKDLLSVCIQVILADGLLHVKESEALRAIADGMDCPMALL